jgi:predicted transcriptional regulator
MFVLFTKKSAILQYIATNNNSTKREVGKFVDNYSYSYKLLKDLENEKYIKNDNSKRVHVLSITEKGKKVIELLEQIDIHNSHTE